MQAFTDLVGTSAVPAHSFDIEELTDLTPALDTATATHDMAEQASEAASTSQAALAGTNGLISSICGVACSSVLLCVAFATEE
jgi:hypothetical protein